MHDLWQEWIGLQWQLIIWSNMYMYMYLLIQIMNDTDAKSYTSGIALHWYQSNLPSANYSELDQIIQYFPDQFLLATEACDGYQSSAEPVILGSWDRGEAYSYDIIKASTCTCNSHILEETISQNFVSHQPWLLTIWP